jgi:hypothetical protein
MLTMLILALLCKTQKGQFIMFRFCRVTPLAIRY